MSRLGVALIWHMHQPYYRDDASGEFVLPWVRLRAAKDYTQMLSVLERHPTACVAMTMVPSLLEQLAAYGRDDVRDYHRDICLRDASTLDERERGYLVEMALRGGFTRRAAILAPLYELCTGLRAEDAATLDTTTVRDLQLWLQLGWIAPAVIAGRDELRGLAERGRGFDEAEKRIVDAVQRELCASVIPRYRALVDAGVIEPVTAPAFHPIVPLLIDHRSARVARPGIELPDPAWRWPGDADVQIASGLLTFTDHAGVKPAGVWPPECAVSPEALQRFARHGFRWAVSDAGVLSASETADGSHDPHRPYAVEEGSTLLFRDSDLSDRIGFAYANRDPHEAVADLMDTLHRIADGAPSDGSALCTIALDGENCWDFYAENGVPFLDALYEALTSDTGVRMTHVSAHLDAFPGTAGRITRLQSGSWIDADFTTWIGDPPHTRAWSLLIAARAALEAQGGPGAHPAAWRELMIAEGSDWFWWFGRRHDSGMDHAWDALFRTHLRNAYRAMGSPVPHDLDQPILDPSERTPLTAPLRSIDPDSGDGEWLCAGRADLDSGLGSMHPSRSRAGTLEYGAAGGVVWGRLAEAEKPAEFSLRVGTGQGTTERFGAGGVARLEAAPGPVCLNIVSTGGTLLPGYEIPLVVPHGGARPQRIALVAAEAAPHLRVGDVGTAVESIAAALTQAGHDCVVLLPGHAALSRAAVLRPEVIRAPDAPQFAVAQRDAAGAPRLRLLNDALFGDRPVYGEGDDGARYAAFGAAAFALLDALSFAPDLVVGLEWQSAVALALARNVTATALAVFGDAPVHHFIHTGTLRPFGLGGESDAHVDLLQIAQEAAQRVLATDALVKDPLSLLPVAVSSDTNSVPAPVPDRPEGAR